MSHIKGHSLRLYEHVHLSIFSSLSNFLLFIYINVICSLYFLVEISDNIHTKQKTLCLLYYRLCGDIDCECGFDVFHPNLFYSNVLQRRISCSWSLQLESGSRTPILHLITHRSEILKQVQYNLLHNLSNKYWTFKSMCQREKKDFAYVLWFIRALYGMRQATLSAFVFSKFWL